MGKHRDNIGKDIPFERIRRITGYLVSDVRRWNKAKKAELSSRVSHSSVGRDDNG